jgi:hypothetical protein
MTKRMAGSGYYAKACDAIAFAHNSINRYRRQRASLSEIAEERIRWRVRGVLTRDNPRLVLWGNDFRLRCPPTYRWQPAYVVPVMMGEIDAPQILRSCSKCAERLLDTQYATAHAGIYQRPTVVIGY